MKISFSDIGHSLTTRSLAKTIRPIIVENLKQSVDKIELDFNGVKVITNCFADECFAKLLIDFDLEFIKSKTSFRNVNPFIQSTIKVAFSNRLSQSALSK